VSLSRPAATFDAPGLPSSTVCALSFSLLPVARSAQADRISEYDRIVRRDEKRLVFSGLSAAKGRNRR